MGALEIIIGAILIVFSLVIILVVLLQEGRQANVGVISGAADSFMDKGAAKSLDQKLSKWTKVIAIAFFILVLVGMLMTNITPATETETKTEGTSSSEVEDGKTNDVELDFSDNATEEHEHTDACDHD